MRAVKQSTARNVMVFMTDSADHVSGKTGLTLTITASKNGAAFASITPTVTERGNGWYNLALTTAHTDTLGDLAIRCTGTGADPSDIAMVVEYEPDSGLIWNITGPLSKTYGLMMAETDAATILRLAAFQAGSTTQALVLDSGASTVDDFYNRATITIVTGASAGQNRLINDYVGSTKTAYLDRPLLVGAPAASDYFAIDSRGNTRSASDLSIGLATAGAASTITLQVGSSASNDFYNRMFILIESGTGEGQARLISSYVGSTRVATVARAWVTQPNSTSRYVILPFGSVKVSEIDAGVIDSTAAPNLDATVSSRSTYAGADTAGTTTLLGRLTALRAGYMDLLNTYLDATVSSRSTYAGVDTAGVTTLLGRIVGTLAAGTHNPQTGDSYARLGAPTLASIAADIQARLAATGYTAPDNAGITAIKAKTDNLPASPAATGDAMALTGAAVDLILDETVEGALTLRKLLRVLLSGVALKSSGAPDGPINFRDLADTKPRITGTIDADGNRTAVTVDGD